MFRKAGIGFAALAMMASGIASALGVGDYELRSYLNQPLDMEVVLTDTQDLTPEEILVSLASQKDFDTAGVDRGYFLSDLKFEVVLDEQGAGIINITSTQPVREPFLNFLVEVMWPTGRMLREYTVLLDPPTYEAASVEVEKAAPQASAPAGSEQEQVVASEPAPKTDTVVAPAPASSAPAPVASSQPAAAPSESSQPAGAYSGPREEYVVQANDTMWSISLRSRPRSSISVQQMLVAIQELNPDAFIDGNVNLVREGTVLRLPSEEEVRRIRTRDALNEIADQNRAWREKLKARGIAIPTRTQLDGTRRAGEQEDTQSAPKEGKVTLVTGKDKAGTSEGAGATGAAGQDTAALENELAIRDENIDSMRRENSELSSRIADLKGQIETSEKLLELRNNQIAQLEEQLRKLQAGEAIEPVTTSTEITEEDLRRLAEAEAADKAAAEQAADTATADEAEGTEDSAEQVADTAEGSEAGEASDEAAAEPSDGEDLAAEGTAEGEAGDQVAGADAAAGAVKPADAAKPDVQTEQVKPVTRPQPTPAPAPEPGIVQLLMDNIIYVAGGLVALLLLVFGIIFMRNRQKSEADSEAAVDLDEMDGGDDDFFVDGIDEEGDEEGFGELEQPAEEAEEPAGQDPLEEVDVYTAYGRHAEAVTFLQNEIDKAPRRGDLKVRLLEVLAEMNDADGFEREAARFADDRDVAGRVDALRASMGGAAAAASPAPADDDDMSLDDLEMDLSSDLGGAPAAEPAEEKESSSSDDDDLSLDFDMDLGGDDSADDSDDATLVLEAADAGDGDDASDGLGDLEFDLGGDDDADDDNTDTLSLESDDEFSLDLEGDSGDSDEDDDLTLSLDSGEEEAPADDLSAELDAAMEVESSLDLGGSDDELSLDMDDEEVSLEDVSTEFSEAAEQPASEEIDLSLDDLEMDSGDGAAQDDGLELDAGLDDDLSLDDEPTEVGMTAVDEEPSSDTVQRESLDQPATDIRPAVDASDVDDDDFDFLGDTDENATKLDLAKAYIDMGDAEGARDILNEVVSEGNPDQQQEAKELLSQVS